jgi:hypothetical protein
MKGVPLLNLEVGHSYAWRERQFIKSIVQSIHIVPFHNALAPIPARYPSTIFLCNQVDTRGYRRHIYPPEFKSRLVGVFRLFSENNVQESYIAMDKSFVVHFLEILAWQ